MSTLLKEGGEAVLGFVLISMAGNGWNREGPSRQGGGAGESFEWGSLRVVDVCDDVIGIQSSLVDDRNFSIGIDQKADWDRKGFSSGDLVVVNRLEVAHQLVGRSSAGEGEFQALCHFLGIRSAGAPLFQTVNCKGDDFDPCSAELLIPCGEVFQFLLAGRAPTGPETEQVGFAFIVRDGFNIAVEGLVIKIRHGKKGGEGNAGGAFGRRKIDRSR